MEHAREADMVLVRLEKGEEVLPALLSAMKAEYVSRAVIMTGLGAMENVEVGYFDLATNSYIKETFKEPHEVLSISGIIAHGGSPPDFQPHLHITLSSANKGAVGGHFFSGRVAITAEFALRAISNGAVHRAKDPVLGLNLLRLHN